MTSKAEAKEALSSLLEELSETLYTNESVRTTVDRLYAIASNIAVLALASETSEHAESLADVLREVAWNKKGQKRLLRKLARYSDDLEEYAERSHYDSLSDEEIEEANELRDAIWSGLTSWLDSL
jgi:hypothetical protein